MYTIRRLSPVITLGIRQERLLGLCYMHASPQTLWIVFTQRVRHCTHAIAPSPLDFDQRKKASNGPAWHPEQYASA